MGPAILLLFRTALQRADRFNRGVAGQSGKVSKMVKPGRNGLRSRGHRSAGLFPKQSLRGRLLHFYYRKGNWVVTGVLLVPDGTSNASRGWRSVLSSQQHL